MCLSIEVIMSSLVVFMTGRDWARVAQLCRVLYTESKYYWKLPYIRLHINTLSVNGEIPPNNQLSSKPAKYQLPSVTRISLPVNLNMYTYMFIKNLLPLISRCKNLRQINIPDINALDSMRDYEQVLQDLIRHVRSSKLIFDFSIFKSLPFTILRMPFDLQSKMVAIDTHSITPRADCVFHSVKLIRTFSQVRLDMFPRLEYLIFDLMFGLGVVRPQSPSHIHTLVTSYDTAKQLPSLILGNIKTLICSSGLHPVDLVYRLIGAVPNLRELTIIDRYSWFYNEKMSIHHFPQWVNTLNLFAVVSLPDPRRGRPKALVRVFINKTNKPIVYDEQDMMDHFMDMIVSGSQ